MAAMAVAAVLVLLAGLLAIGQASARSAPSAVSLLATQRGPDPTIAMIEATRGPFATAQVSMPTGQGFGGGTIYYPTDTSQGTWGALAIVPGYSARFADEEAWMGPWLSSFGFVVIGVETNTRTDSDSQRAAELLAALNYVTTQSPVRNQVDPDRLSVLGHSAGGAGAIEAAEQRPSLRALIGLAPGFPGQGLSMASDTVPALIIGGQNDGTVNPSYLASLYGTLPVSTQSAFAQIAGADHVYYTHPNNVEMKLIIPWLKVFVDSDTRYTQFLCPSLPDPSTISAYQPKCPYIPPGGPSSSSSSSSPSSPSSSTPPPGSGPLEAVGAGKCLDVPNSSTTGGTQLQIYTCTGGANQLFTRTSSKQLTVYSGGMCLDANGRGTTNGTKVIIWTCNGATNQQWNLNSNGTITGVASGLCLDVSGASTANGALVQLWTCNGQSNQQWHLG